MTNEIEAKNKINDSSDNVGSAGNSSDTANPKSFVSCTDLKIFYFTFGYGQKHEGCYVTIYAVDEESARHKMCEEFGSEWCGCYNEENADEGIFKWNYKFLASYRAY